LERKTLGRIARSSTPSLELRRSGEDSPSKREKRKQWIRRQMRIKKLTCEKNSLGEMDDIDECASLIGIPVTRRESLVMSTNERRNDRTTSGGRRSSSMKTNQFVIKHEASKQRVLDKIVIWHKIVQQRCTYHILSLSPSLFCFGSILCCSQSGNDPLEVLANFGYKLNMKVEFLNNLFFFWLPT